MTDPNYYGLARALYTGTWSAGAGATYPIVNSRELRGSLQYVSGDLGDRLTDISKQRVEYGMIVFVKNTYINTSSTTINGGSYYQYNAVAGDGVRSVGAIGGNLANGQIPNNDANWSVFNSGGEGGKTGPTGPTGYASQGSWTPFSPANRIIGGVTGGVFKKVYNVDGFNSAVRSVQSINGPCFVSFSPGELTTDLIVALNNRTPNSYDPSSYALATNSNAAWVLTSTSTVTAYANGSATPVTLSNPQITSYSVNDIFSIIYDGTNLNYYYNGVSKASVPITTPVGNPLYLDANIKQENGTVRNLVFGYAGYAGSAGTPGGPTGATGATGPTGPSGPLGFIVDPSISYQRNLVTYFDADGPKSIRQYVTYTNPVGGGQMFAVQLASFSPTLEVSNYSPRQYLRWDEPFTSFTVRVSNPSDYISQYISSVINLASDQGIKDESTTTLGEFVAPFSADAIVPAGGNSTIGGGTGWTQIFRTSNTTTQGLIRSKTTNISGGAAAATIHFRSITNGGAEQLYTSSSLAINVSWSDASNSLNINSNSGNIFLNPYLSTTYTSNHGGTINAPVHTLTPVGGSITSNTEGTFTYSSPVTPFTTTSGITLQLSSRFTRPTGVAQTGSYASTNALAAQQISASFVYPSFYMFTDSISTEPGINDIVNGTDYRTSGTLPNPNTTSKVYKLTDKQTTIGTSASAVPIGVPPYTSAGFWFGVLKSSDITLSTFGSGSGVLNASQTDTTSTVKKIDRVLYSSGANSITFTIYGFTVNPLTSGGPTYVFASTS